MKLTWAQDLRSWSPLVAPTDAPKKHVFGHGGHEAEVKWMHDNNRFVSQAVGTAVFGQQSCAVSS